MRAIPLMLALGLVAGMSGVAAAGDSPWTVKIGASQIKPKSDSDTSNEVGLTPAIEYKFSPNVVGEVLLAIPFEHDVDDGAGTKIASFKHLPPTFTAKYLFSPGATFSPYVGLGLNYTMVFSQKLDSAFAAANLPAGSTLSAEDSFGLAATAGFEYRMANSPWGVALDVRYIKISSDIEIKSGAGAVLVEDTLKLDPLVVGLSAAYHF